MTKHVRPTFADPSLPSDVLVKMEKANKVVKALNIWFRTHANATMHPLWHGPELPISKLPGQAQPDGQVSELTT